MSSENFDETKVDKTNLGAVWERVALFVKKITGNVNVAKDGTLQDQINGIKASQGGLEFGISENGCLTVTYDDET